MTSERIDLEELSQHRARMVFGRGFFLEIENHENQEQTFTLGCTHHGFRMTEEQLQTLIDEVRESKPELSVD
jgi:hypothetical protein